MQDYRSLNSDELADIAIDAFAQPLYKERKKKKKKEPVVNKMQLSIKDGFKVSETRAVKQTKIIKKTYTKKSSAFVKKWQENKR